MFKNSPVFASFAVDDPQKAKDFYQNTLNLDVTEVKDMDGLLQIHSPIQGTDGGGTILVYPKPEGHVPANFTVLNIPVDDVKAAMSRLKDKGVKFEVYDGAAKDGGMKTDKDGLFESDGMSIAWFKDPAGNVLSILNEAA